MALYEIPTGILLEEIVETLPETGEENKVYRRLVEEEWMREQQITDDFIWYDGEWHPFSFDAKIFGAYFARFQQSLDAVLSDYEARIEALEGGTQYVVAVDVSNYTAPNKNTTPKAGVWDWEASLEYEATGIYADGVPCEVTSLYTMNDTDIVLVLDNGVSVYLHDREDLGSVFTSYIEGRDLPSEVTFERLIIRYEIYQ